MVLSQFSSEMGKNTLADLDFKFPVDVYPVGRLDEDSEGLLILTNDKKLNHLLLDPDYKHKRTYLVQVEGDIKSEAVIKLNDSILINISGKEYLTIPAVAVYIPQPTYINERNPPVRFRKNIPTSWIKLEMKEGKNRQVRKMTAKVGYPTLRLIRVAIEELYLESMQPGDIKEIDRNSIYKKLNIKC